MTKQTLTFSETMSGHFALGVTDTVEGVRLGQQNNTSLAMHAQVGIDDLDRFIRDPEHLGSLRGSIDFAPFGIGIQAPSGVFNLFKPTNDPDLTYMVYELAFQHQGQDYYLAGHKEVKDDPGFDLWSDTTTLYTTLHEGQDKQGRIVGAGVLTLGIRQLAMLLSTVAVPNATIAGKLATIAKFACFFAGRLWASYVVPKFRK